MFIFPSEYMYISPLRQRGDLLTFTTGDARLPLGLQGQVLTVDTNTATFLRWVNIEELLTSSDFSIFIKLDESGRLPAVDGSRLTNISYNNLVNKPSLFSGNYNDLTNKPILGTASSLNTGTSPNNVVKLDSLGRLPILDGSLLTNITVSYLDLTDKPSLFSGNYNDLTNKPVLGTSASLNTGTSPNNVIQLDSLGRIPALNGSLLTNITVSYLDLTNKPVLFSGNYNDLTNKPSLFSGDYNDLINKPVISNFSGSYNDLTNKPSLGTASSLNFGTSANNLVQLDSSSKLPSIDGSQLTNLGVPYQKFKTVLISNYTITQSDHGFWIPCDTNNLIVTLPSGLTSGTQVLIQRLGTATVSVTNGVGTTIIGKGLNIANQYSVIHCVYNGTNWYLTGDLN